MVGLLDDPDEIHLAADASGAGVRCGRPEMSESQ